MKSIIWILALTVLGGCSSLTAPSERWVVQCFDVFGRETTILFGSESAAIEWQRSVETREPGGPNPLICNRWTEEEYES